MREACSGIVCPLSVKNHKTEQYVSSCSRTRCDSEGPQTILFRAMDCVPGSPSFGSRNTVPTIAAYPVRST